ncbi:MAG: FtsX-like permease family protein, partial [Clostridiales bacterium]|nr:FtsX-like permease family protein [Clostridiales bacterium]
MLTLLFRKMRNTKWMVICLLIGFIMASAMMSTIPIFMNASLQRMLIKDIESFQLENEVYPGVYSAKRTIPNITDTKKQIEYAEKFDQVITQKFNSLGIPMQNEKMIAVDEYMYVKSLKITASNEASRISVGGMSNIKDHIKIVEGEMFKTGINDEGAFEVIMNQQALQITKLTVGGVYEIANIFENEKATKIKVVGTFDVKDENDSYWSEGVGIEYISSFFMDYDTFMDEGMKTNAFGITKVEKRICMDYPKIDMLNLAKANETISTQIKEYRELGFTFTMPAQTIFQDYAQRASQLRLILWLLQIPVMLMIVFYLFMVSKLNVEQEKNEISVFKSRGASSLQIMTIYALESLVLGVVTAIIGPLVGLGFCQVLGASNGFLEFVNRKALPVRLSTTAFVYALIAVAVFFVTTMLPIFPATKDSIVAHKQSKARKSKRPLWEKLFLDIILMAGSVGWVFYYYKTQEKLIADGVTNTLATINPLLFIASTAFILGAGLFVVRVYPLIVRLVYRIGKRVWSPAAYVSLNNIGRSSTGRERFIMSFLILTVALGLFFANTARALNQNAVDRVSYKTGADAVIVEEWKGSLEGETEVTTPQQGAEQQEETGEEDTSSYSYVEPIFERFEELSGVNVATKVLKRSGVSVKGNTIDKEVKQKENDYRNEDWQENGLTRTTGTVDDVQLMTVIPHEFSKVCWFRDDLLPSHINNYLNALSKYPSGVILSSRFEDYGVKLGDNV